jgi:CBS domain-containing protein
MTCSTVSTITVGDVMSPSVINTPPQTPAVEVASLMARSQVHCVVVEGLARDRHRQEHLVWGIVSDLDLMKALAAERADATAGELAATEIVTVEPSESIEQVARLMAEHECTHLVVTAADSGEPIGVISSLDVAQGMALAGPLELPKAEASA